MDKIEWPQFVVNGVAAIISAIVLFRFAPGWFGAFAVALNLVGAISAVRWRDQAAPSGCPPPLLPPLEPGTIVGVDFPTTSQIPLILHCEVVEDRGLELSVIAPSAVQRPRRCTVRRHSLRGVYSRP